MGGATCRAIVNFVDYGNRASIAFEDLAPLSDLYASAKPFAHEYALACVTMPPVSSLFRLWIHFLIVDTERIVQILQCSENLLN